VHSAFAKASTVAKALADTSCYSWQTSSQFTVTGAPPHSWPFVLFVANQFTVCSGRVPWPWGQCPIAGGPGRAYLAAMVNKDQLDQSPEGKQVLQLLEEHFPGEHLQPALTLIEQRYTEDQTVWDADLNREGKLPFTRTTDAHRLLTFFASPAHLVVIKTELAQRAVEAARQAAAAAPTQTAVSVKPPAKARTKPKPRPRRAPGSKPVKPKARRPHRSKPVPPRPKRKAVSAKAAKLRAKAPKKRKR